MSAAINRNDPAVIAAIRARAPGWFALADSVVLFSDQLIDRIQPMRDDGLQVLCALLFRRLLSAYQAVIILAERGMHTEGLIQRRGMLEALFALGAMWQQPTTVQDYIRNDLHRRRDIYKNLLKASADMRKTISASISETELRRRAEELTKQTKGVTYLSVEEFSQRAKLHDLYLTDYCVLSEASHHGPRDLERHIIVGADDDIEELIWGFEPDPPFKLLFPATDQMLMGVHVVDKLFALSIATNIRKFSDESRRLSSTDETGDG
jgi:hypothetical protein